MGNAIGCLKLTMCNSANPVSTFAMFSQKKIFYVLEKKGENLSRIYIEYCNYVRIEISVKIFKELLHFSPDHLHPRECKKFRNEIYTISPQGLSTKILVHSFEFLAYQKQMKTLKYTVK